MVRIIYINPLDIFIGVNIRTNEEVAIKMVKFMWNNKYIKESSKAKHPQLSYETKILQYLKGGTGIPNVHYYCVSGEYNFMVIDLLGPSIEDLFTFCSRKFSLKTVLMLVDQMVKINI